MMRHYPVAVLCTLLFSVIFMKSCANTTTPPSGGVKDTIPPVLLYVEPQNLATNVSRDKGYVKMTFDEYVVVKTASDIFLSPPMEKKPVHKIRGKSIIVSFDGKLDSNRTYVLDMGQSVADNNEGNIYPGFVIAFSTGNTVDSMYLTGTVSDCNTLACAAFFLMPGSIAARRNLWLDATAASLPVYTTLLSTPAYTKYPDSAFSRI